MVPVPVTNTRYVQEDELKLAKCVIVVQLSVADCVVMALRVGQLLWRKVIVDKRTDPPYYAGSYGLVYELRSGPTADPHYARLYWKESTPLQR